MHRTAAGLDQALLIAMAGRAELYDTALKRLETERILPFETQLLSALIAQTLIRGERGDDVVPMALVALNGLRDANGNDGPLPAFLSIAAVRQRLETLAAR